ncbi:MAG: hypothetical protein ACLGIV_12425 [Actinomycetes bacterium]
MAAPEPLNDHDTPAVHGDVAAASIVVRLWSDPAFEGFRARVTWLPGVGGGPEDVRVVDSPQAVTELVRQHLEKFTGS